MRLFPPLKTTRRAFAPRTEKGAIVRFSLTSLYLGGQKQNKQKQEREGGRKKEPCFLFASPRTVFKNNKKKQQELIFFVLFFAWCAHRAKPRLHICVVSLNTLCLYCPVFFYWSDRWGAVLISKVRTRKRKATTSKRRHTHKKKKRRDDARCCRLFLAFRGM